MYLLLSHGDLTSLPKIQTKILLLIPCRSVINNYQRSTTCSQGPREAYGCDRSTMDPTTDTGTKVTARSFNALFSVK